MNLLKSKSILAICFFLSLVILYPVASLSFRALADLYSYQALVDNSMEFNLPRFHYFLKNKVQREQIKLTAQAALEDKGSKLKTFNITIDPKYIHKLNSNLPESGKSKYYNAYLSISDAPEIQKIKLRYRGAGNYHWINEKKSLKIKTKNYQMHKKFSLINPVLINSFHDIINYQLSQELGIISPEIYPARVKVNGEFMGVYLFLSQVDESLLRKHKRMPGSIYYGDLAAERQYQDLWSDEQSWTKKAARNKAKKQDRTDIQYFINTIKNSTESEFNEFVETYINKDAYFNFIALDRLFGSHHHDYVHNHKLYFDPYKGKFEPISWDLRFWQSVQQKDLSLYPLQLRLASNPIYDADIDKRVYQLLQNNSVSSLIQRYKTIIQTIMPDLKADIYRDHAVSLPFISKRAISEPYSIDDIMDTIVSEEMRLNGRFSYLKSLYKTVGFSYTATKQAENAYQLNFTISGNNPISIDFSALEQRNKITEDQRIITQPYIIYPAKTRVRHTQTRYDTIDWGDTTVQNSAQHYQLTLYKNSQESLEKVLSKIRFTNLITNEKVERTPTTQTAPNDTQITKEKQPDTIKKIILQGNVHIHKTKIYNKNTHLIIKPGTTITLSPKQSIFIYGKLTAIGSKESPIEFKAKNPSKPWGIIAIQGQSASGSQLQHCRISNGSVDSRNLINYTAPLNFHDLKNFNVSHCRIERNYIGDDALHIAYAQGKIEHNIFSHAHSDSLDIDISHVSVNNNLFYASGNDGLDIMTTELSAHNNLFIKNADKGISIGEWSQAEITQSYFLENKIALEIKDQSIVTAKFLIIESSLNKAINLYHKNKRYNKGGELKASQISLIGNTKVTVDKRSKIIKLEQAKPNTLQKTNWAKKLQQRILDEHYEAL